MGVRVPQSSICDFFTDLADASASLVTVNRTGPGPVRDLLADAFAAQSVALSERTLPTDCDDLLALRKDGEIVAVSPLDRVMQSYLLVNTDRFTTSTRVFDGGLPTVLTNLDETLLDLRGYPVSNKEKLLLVLISRHIERLAYEAGNGTLRSTFQRLSRLEDEPGTRRVYERLSGRTLDVHVYGVPDASPTRLDATVHGGTSDEYRNCWCVVFHPEDGSKPAALVAHQRDANRWKGFWTYDPERIERIDAYLERTF
jgi:hypothetical protein